VTRLPLLLFLTLAGCGPAGGTRVGSKADSESVVLGELARYLTGTGGALAGHRRELGGTAVLWDALRAGQIDVYPEFTGTLAFGIIHDPAMTDLDRLKTYLDGQGLGMTPPLGYENNYAIGVPAATADRLGLATISDLAKHPDLRLGLSTEFTRREDGWPALKRHYALPQAAPRPLEHAIAYQAIATGQIDATDVYTTDAEIDRYHLRVLADDRAFFPKYAAIYLYRKEWAAANPTALASLERLAGKLDVPSMRAANARTLAKEPEARTAAGLLRDRLGVEVTAAEESRGRLLLKYTGQHLALVAVSLGAAVVVAIPLGVLAARRPRLGQVVVGFAGLVQTIPSLALLVILVAVPIVGGLGPRPAVIALFLYSLLPIVRNTAAGLADILPALREVADGLGLSAWAKLRRVELPLASRSILAGVKTAAVINIGTATLGALIDAGGLGVPIQQGLRTNDREWILLGALPAAGLALLAQGVFGLAERWVVPRGLRLVPTR